MNKVNTFIIPIEVQQSTSIRVTYCWEVKISRVGHTYFGSAVCDNFAANTWKWTNLEVKDEASALDRLESFCRRNSK